MEVVEKVLEPELVAVVGCERVEQSTAPEQVTSEFRVYSPVSTHRVVVADEACHRGVQLPFLSRLHRSERRPQRGVQRSCIREHHMRVEIRSAGFRRA